jgi:hypothetical protein
VLNNHDYAYYEVNVEGGGKGYTTKDTDENMASLKNSPRERLFDAIEQDCSYEHIDYLFTNAGIDVTIFHDVVVSQAIKYASTNGLSWLQGKVGLDLHSSFDE